MIIKRSEDIVNQNLIISGIPFPSPPLSASAKVRKTGLSIETHSTSLRRYAQHRVAARTPCHAARVLCHASKSSEYAKSRPFYATSGFLIYAVLRRFRLRIVDHFHLRIGEIERLHVFHLFDLCVNHRFKRRRVEPDAMLAENLLRIGQLPVTVACTV